MTLLPDIPEIAFACATVLIAAFIRGYSGFGFSMITTVSLSMVFTPVEVVPVVLILEIMASSLLLPGVWRQVDWKALGWLSLGVVAGTPVGVTVLANVPARPMRAGISITVILLVALLFSGFKLNRKPGAPATVATGLASGTLNGAATIGGPPVILFFFSSRAGVDISRASLIAFFFGTDILASGFCIAQGLIHRSTLVLSAALLIPLVAGIQLGSRSFLNTDPGIFKKRVMLLLMTLSVVSLAKSIWG